MGNHRMRRGGPLDKHAYRQGGHHITIRQLPRHQPHTTTNQNDHADAGSRTTGPTANQPIMRRLAPPDTNHAAIEPTPDCKQTTRKPAKTEPARHERVKTGTPSSGRATLWCATPANHHTYERNSAPHLYYYTTDQPTTTTCYEPPAPGESASSTESGGVSTRHSKRVP